MTNWTATTVFSFTFFKSLYDGEDANCQFFPYKTEFKSLQDVFDMSASRSLLEKGTKPWYVGWWVYRVTFLISRFRTSRRWPGPSRSQGLSLPLDRCSGSLGERCPWTAQSWGFDNRPKARTYAHNPANELTSKLHRSVFIPWNNYLETHIRVIRLVPRSPSFLPRYLHGVPPREIFAFYRLIQNSYQI